MKTTIFLPVLFFQVCCLHCWVSGFGRMRLQGWMSSPASCLWLILMQTQVVVISKPLNAQVSCYNVVVSCWMLQGILLFRMTQSIGRWRQTVTRAGVTVTLQQRRWLRWCRCPSACWWRSVLRNWAHLMAMSSLLVWVKRYSVILTVIPVV